MMPKKNSGLFGIFTVKEKLRKKFEFELLFVSKWIGE